MKKYHKTIFLLAVVTVIFGTIYVAGQQILRQSANDPQIQMAEDIALKLSTNISVPADFMAPDRTQTDISQSLSPFVMIFDDKNILLESSAKLHESAISLPIGVFDYAREKGENRFTWQPEKGVRSAVVLKYYDGIQSGFVLVGRSLREVEIREGNLLLLVGFGWFVSVALILMSNFW